MKLIIVNEIEDLNKIISLNVYYKHYKSKTLKNIRYFYDINGKLIFIGVTKKWVIRGSWVMDTFAGCVLESLLITCGLPKDNMEFLMSRVK